MGFRLLELYSGFQKQNFPDSGFHKQLFSRFPFMEQTEPIRCDTPLVRSAQRSFAPLQKSSRNYRCFQLCEQKPYGVWYRPKSYPLGAIDIFTFPPLNVNWTFRVGGGGGGVVRQWTLVRAFLDKSKLIHFHTKILRHVWNGARDIIQ